MLSHGDLTARNTHSRRKSRRIPAESGSKSASDRASATPMTEVSDTASRISTRRKSSNAATDTESRDPRRHHPARRHLHRATYPHHYRSPEILRYVTSRGPFRFVWTSECGDPGEQTGRSGNSELTPKRCSVLCRRYRVGHPPCGQSPVGRRRVTRMHTKLLNEILYSPAPISVILCAPSDIDHRHFLAEADSHMSQG
jgi:hypothetical protein